MSKLEKRQDNPTFFTYKVAYDAGNAPNPDHNLCTLAICKPVIRRTAKVGDIILGVGCKDESNQIVYCMIVDEVLSWQDYILRCEADPAFQNRIPQNETEHGDCIWYLEQLDHCHEPRKSASKHDQDNYHTDIVNGKNVLISRSYWYFGSGNQYDIRLPEMFNAILPSRGHKSRANAPHLDNFIYFFNSELEKYGINGFGKYGKPKVTGE